MSAMFASPCVEFKSMKFISVISTVKKVTSLNHLIGDSPMNAPPSLPFAGKRKIRDSREVRPAATKGGSLPASEP